MNTTILVLIIIMIVAGMFLLGVRVGAGIASKNLCDAMVKSFDESSNLTDNQKLEIIRRIREELKKI